MKKSIILIIPVLISLFFSSCKSKEIPVLLGNWKADVTLKSELAGNESASDSPVAYLYTKQKIDLAFSEGGCYTKKVAQNVEKIEFVKDGGNETEAMEYFSQFFNKNLVFDGEYQQLNGNLCFTVDRVQQNDGASLPYSEAFEKDPSIGDDQIDEPYEVKDGELFIGGVKYKKAD